MNPQSHRLIHQSWLFQVPRLVRQSSSLYNFRVHYLPHKTNMPKEIQILLKRELKKICPCNNSSTLASYEDEESRARPAPRSTLPTNPETARSRSSRSASASVSQALPVHLRRTYDKAYPPKHGNTPSTLPLMKEYPRRKQQAEIKHKITSHLASSEPRKISRKLATVRKTESNNTIGWNTPLGSQLKPGVQGWLHTDNRLELRQQNSIQMLSAEKEIVDQEFSGQYADISGVKCVLTNNVCKNRSRNNTKAHRYRSARSLLSPCPSISGLKFLSTILLQHFSSHVERVRKQYAEEFNSSCGEGLPPYRLVVSIWQKKSYHNGVFFRITRVRTGTVVVTPQFSDKQRESYKISSYGSRNMLGVKTMLKSFYTLFKRLEVEKNCLERDAPSTTADQTTSRVIRSLSVNTHSSMWLYGIHG